MNAKNPEEGCMGDIFVRTRMVKKAVSRGKRGGCDRQRGRFCGIYCCAPHYYKTHTTKSFGISCPFPQVCISGVATLPPWLTSSL